MHIFWTPTTPILTALLMLVLTATPAAAQSSTDRIRLTRGSETGEISDMSPLEVTIGKSASSKKTIAVNEIKSILFDDEPAELAQARLQAANGNFTNAAAKLEKIDLGAIQRDLIKQDVEFYRAYCAAKLALGGTGQIGDAGRLLSTFVRSYPKNFHYLAAVETMGDLLMASERYDSAQKQYAELAKAPWPAYKTRAAVSIGRTLQAQDKHAEAIQQFDSALTIAGDDADAKSQVLSATLAKAVSLAETGHEDDAIGAIEKVIQDADPEERELHARAYNALGTCYEEAGKSKDALLAFLHVDVLFNTEPEAHAEALSHLVPLWKAVGQDQRSRQARQQLDERYANSRWAK